MLVVTTSSVAAAATASDAAAAPVSSSHSHFSESLSLVFSMLIVSRWPRLPFRARTHTGNFPSRRLQLEELVAVSGCLIPGRVYHLSFSLDDDETRRAINPRRGAQRSTVDHCDWHPGHRKASKATHSGSFLMSIAYRHHRLG
jgi:hypothetical protein